jgi:hypothetical protein
MSGEKQPFCMLPITSLIAHITTYFVTILYCFSYRCSIDKLSGICICFVWCQLAWSIIMTPCLFVGMVLDISCKWSSKHAPLAYGKTSPAPCPELGQIAPKIYWYKNCCCFTTLGLVPLMAHILVLEPCCPIRVSSWNQISTSSSVTPSGMISLTFSWSFF